MKHPSSRSERRFARHTAIQIRLRCIRLVWKIPCLLRKPGKYAKWNLNCGCTLCHCGKYFGPKRKRRRALIAAIAANVREWQE